MTAESLGHRGGGGREFGATLARLKRHGCNLLVTGDVSPAVSGLASRRLLGAPSATRKRLLVLPEGRVDDADATLPGGCTTRDPDVTVVAWDGTVRSAIDGRSGGDDPAVVDGAADLRGLRERVCDAVVAFDESASGLDPAEFRLSMYGLGLLVDEYGPGRVSQFLRATTALTDGVDGMAHYHLPVPDDSPTVADLAPLFDARIELRQSETLVPEQRWHLGGEDASGWVRL